MLDFKPSRRLTFALGCLLLAVLVIVLAAPMPWWIKLMLFLVGLPMAAYVLAKDVLLCLPCSWVRLELTHQGEIKLKRKNGQLELAQIMPSSYVTSHLTILHLKLESSRWPSHILILPDSLSEASFRQLRVWLRWGLSFHQAAIRQPQDFAEDA